MPKHLLSLAARTLPVVLFASALYGAQAQAAELIESAAGESGLAAVHVGDRLVVRTGDRVLSSETLAAGHKITSIVELEHGWAIAGTRPGASGHELFVLASRVEGDLVTSHALPRPVDIRDTAETVFQSQPVLLSFDGQLDGLVWLEGSDRQSLSVKAARFADGRWKNRRTLARAEHGSQLALSSITLPNGGWLAVWSRFDGQDDEIFWARLGPNGWSAAQRLARDNRVPDITPHLIPNGTGALAVWSRYDGSDYRVVVARYRNGLWSPPETVGEAGSIFPRAVRHLDATYLIYRRVEPSAWSWVELNSRGDEVERRSLPSARRDRPMLLRREEGMRLAWPEDNQTGLGAPMAPE